MKTMTLKEAAAWLGIHERTLAARAASGKIPGAKISHKAWRFLEEDLAAWLRSKYIEPSPPISIQKKSLSIDSLLISRDVERELDALLAQRPKARPRRPAPIAKDLADTLP